MTYEKELLQKVDAAVKANDWDKVDELRAELSEYRVTHPFPIDDEDSDDETEDFTVDEDEYPDEDESYKSWEQRAWEDSGMTWKDFA